MSKVIMYHYVRKFNKELPFFNFLHERDFYKQFNFLKKRYSFFKNGIEDLKKSNKILLSFDDGLKEHLKVGKFLKKNKIKGIFFISSYPLIKKDFLTIHKLHLIFGKYNSNIITDLLKKFKIYYNEKYLFKVFKKQKKFLKKEKNIENQKKIKLKTILNNIAQENPKIINKLFNECFSKVKQKKIFKNFYMSSKDIKKLNEYGMLIGAHGNEHLVLSQLKNKDLVKDLNLSIISVKRIIRKNITLFCYPYGGSEVFNEKVVKLLKEKGIKYAFNVESKNYFKNSDNFAIPRFDCNEFKHGELFSK